MAGGHRNSAKASGVGILARFARSRDGVAAIEFALLAIPFFLIVFAIIETFVAYAGEQVLENAVDTMGRKLRTGQITYNVNPATDETKSQFRAEFCEEISIMMSCPGGSSQKLYLDVREFASFADMPAGVPRQGGNDYGDLDTTGFAYSPGKPGDKNMLRAYYRWPIIVDLVRPMISNVRTSAGASSDYFLMVATAAFENENYPTP